MKLPMQYSCSISGTCRFRIFFFHLDIKFKFMNLFNLCGNVVVVGNTIVLLLLLQYHGILSLLVSL